MALAKPEEVVDGMPLSATTTLIVIYKSSCFESVEGSDRIGLDGTKHVKLFGVVFSVFASVKLVGGNYVNKKGEVDHVFAVWLLSTATFPEGTEEETPNPLRNIIFEN